MVLTFISNASILKPAKFLRIGTFDGKLMKRSLLMNEDLIVGDSEVVIDVAQRMVISLTLEVTLLLCGMASLLSFRCVNGQRVDVAIGARDPRALVDMISPSHIRFELPRNQAEFLQAVLLRTYRDEMAEVNHIHLEGYLSGDPFDLTFVFEVHQPSLSPTAANMLLGVRPRRGRRRRAAR